MNIKGSVALVTGANRGIGQAFVKALLERGAAKVYAGMRDTKGYNPAANVEAIQIDITNEADISAAAKNCSDVSLLINNGGVNHNTSLIAHSDIENARTEIETNYFGSLNMCRAFAPMLKANGGGAIINMLSILARVNLPLMGSLCASKAAALSMTQGIRAELAGQQTTVIAVMPGAVDTRMSDNFPPPKADPKDVAAEVLDGIEAGVEEIYPGDMAKGVSQGLAADPKSVEKKMGGYLPG
ncbi:MAG: SDR family oxidoreductase [Alphaproteobacteria bacterium]|nr:SDR family oxidoreductase [Alphaproteobacteria bacterium]